MYKKENPDIVGVIFMRLFFDKEISNGIQHRSTCQSDTGAVHFAMEVAASGGNLSCDDFLFAQFFRPQGNDMAVAAAADGIFGHSQFGTEGTGDTVIVCTPGGDMLQEAVQYAQEQSGKKLIVVDTPVINVDDNPIEGIRQAELISAEEFETLWQTMPATQGAPRILGEGQKS